MRNSGKDQDEEISNVFIPQENPLGKCNNLNSLKTWS